MISVCMTSFNGGKFIRKQILSILNQLASDDELIISDDGSTDNTIEIITDINDNRIKLLCHKSKKNNLSKLLGVYRLVADNCAYALSYAKGDIIFLADQDDLWDTNRVSRMVDALSCNDLVMCNYKIIDDDDNCLGCTPAYTKAPITGSFIHNIIKSRFMLCCMAFRGSLLKYILPIPNNLLSMDQWIGGLATFTGKVAFVHDVYHLYRRHGNNVSFTSEKSKNPLYVKIFFRFSMLFKILARVCKTN